MHLKREIISILLYLLYSDEVQIGPETVMTTLYTAKKYAVPALERRCVEFLQNHLSSDNAFMLLTQVMNDFRYASLVSICKMAWDFRSRVEAIFFLSSKVLLFKVAMYIK